MGMIESDEKRYLSRFGVDVCVVGDSILALARTPNNDMEVVPAASLVLSTARH